MGSDPERNPSSDGLRAQTGHYRPVPLRCQSLPPSDGSPCPAHPSAVAPCRAISARTGTVDHTSPVPHWSRTTPASQTRLAYHNKFVILLPMVRWALVI